MGRKQPKDQRRNKENVGYEKTRYRECAHLRSTAHHPFDALANPGGFAYRICSYCGCEIGPLVPGKQVPSKSHRKDQAEEHASRQPKQLAPAFVRSVDIRLRQVEEQDDNHRAYPIPGEPPEKRAGGLRLRNVRSRSVRVIGRGHVVESKKYSGDYLRN